MVNFKLNDSNTPKACEISRRTKIAAIFFFSVAALGVGGFWYAKNVSSTGNPVWPLAYSIFGDATNTWDAAVNARWTAAHSSHEFSLSTFVSSVTAFVARDDFASPMIAVFGILAILALFNPAQNGSRVVRCQMIYIMGYVLFFVAVWWFSTHRLIRFFDPVLPVLSVALAVGITRFAESFRTRAATAVLYAILFFCSWYAVVLNATTGNDLWVPNDRFLAERSRYGDWPVFFQETSQEDGWPSDQKLLLVGEARAFAYRVPLLYSTCWNRSPLRNCLPDSFFARIKEARDNRQTIRFDWTDEEKHEITTRLADEKIALILVDWGELERFNSPGNYGLVDADILCPDFFASLVRVKILEPFFPQEYETFSLRTKEKTTLYKVCEPLVSK